MLSGIGSDILTNLVIRQSYERLAMFLSHVVGQKAEKSSKTLQKLEDCGQTIDTRSHVIRPRHLSNPTIPTLQYIEYRNGFPPLGSGWLVETWLTRCTSS